MADTDMLFLVHWEDRMLSVIEKGDILEPLKENYVEGELIFAKFGKKRYEAVICEVHPNMKYLMKQAKLPPKYSYTEVKQRQNALPTVPSLSGPYHSVVPSKAPSDFQSEKSSSQPEMSSSQPEKSSRSQSEKSPGQSEKSSRSQSEKSSGQSEKSSSQSEKSSGQSEKSSGQSEKSSRSQSEKSSRSQSEKSSGQSEKSSGQSEKSSSQSEKSSGQSEESFVQSEKSSMSTSSQSHRSPSHDGKSSSRNSEKSSSYLPSISEKRKEFSLEEECRSLRKKVKKLEERVTALEEKPGSTKTEDDMAQDLVAHLNASDTGEIVQILARYIFTEEELKNCSRTGKKTVKSGESPRPPLNQQKLNKLERLVILKTKVAKEVFIKKFENFQKVLRRK